MRDELERLRWFLADNARESHLKRSFHAMPFKLFAIALSVAWYHWRRLAEFLLLGDDRRGQLGLRHGSKSSESELEWARV